MNLKKCFLMMFAAVALTSCNDDCDHNLSNDSDMNLVGTWYEEILNEEFRFSAGNTFYSKSCYSERSFEAEGIYELDSKNKRLTMSYKYMGQNQYLDWKLLSFDEYCFQMSSETVGSWFYYRVVDTFNLEAGATTKISQSSNLPSGEILSYRSLNENIATVSSDGLISTTGEKGSAYIKVEYASFTVIVKVIVGVDRYDLWMDYSTLLDKDVNEIRRRLGSPSQTNEYSYGYLLDMHDVLDFAIININTDSQKVDLVELYCKSEIPSADIISYIKDKYYYFDSINGWEYYMTSPTIADSRAVVVYVGKENAVLISSAEPYKNPGLWDDYSKSLKRSHDEIVSIYGDPISDDGVDIMYLYDGKTIRWVDFTLGETGKVKTVSLILYDDLPSQEVINYLNSIYKVFASGTLSDGSQYAWKNEEETIGIIYTPSNNLVTYYDLSK